jgi:ABC-type uncharacterized transport system YnjBCD substrate-binding protein
MSKQDGVLFTSETSAGLLVTMGEKGSVQFRDGVAVVDDPDQLEELREWIKRNPEFQVHEGAAKEKKEERAPLKSGSS